MSGEQFHVYNFILGTDLFCSKVTKNGPYWLKFTKA